MTIERRAAFAALDVAQLAPELVARVATDEASAAAALDAVADLLEVDGFEPTSALAAPERGTVRAALVAPTLVDPARAPGYRAPWFVGDATSGPVPQPAATDADGVWLLRCEGRGGAGALAGLRLGVKANIAVAGLPMSCGSRMLAGYVPAADATVVARLRAGGASVVGVTNMDEFAMGSSGERSAFGPTVNPWCPTLVPGGSSSGSAAAVARGDVPVALGTDSGGSVRQPAACCGIVGYKPSYGLLSRRGVAAYASSLDTVGVLARAVRDVVRVVEVMAGADPGDATTHDGRWRHGDEVSTWRGVRLGVPEAWLDAAAPDAPVWASFRDTCAALREAGATLVDVRLPSWRAALPAYGVLSYAEAASNLARYTGVYVGEAAGARTGATWSEAVAQRRSTLLGPEVQRRLLLGAGWLVDHPERLQQAMRVRTRVIADAARALHEVDALLLPTSPHEPFEVGAMLTSSAGMTDADRYTVPANLAGLPAVSVPWRAGAGVPGSAQLIGSRFDDARVLVLAQALEELRGPLATPGEVRR